MLGRVLFGVVSVAICASSEQQCPCPSGDYCHYSTGTQYPHEGTCQGDPDISCDCTGCFDPNACKDGPAPAPSPAPPSPSPSPPAPSPPSPSPSSPLPRVAMWSWQTAIVNRDEYQDCWDEYKRLIHGNETSELLRGGVLYQDTTSILTCESLIDIREKKLPTFTDSMTKDLGISVEWMYAENWNVSTSSSAGIEKWLRNAIDAYRNLSEQGLTLPVGFHFDVEYSTAHNAGTEGAEAVLGLAKIVRESIQNASFAIAPKITWDVQDAAHSTTVSCPDGEERTIAACFLLYVDAVAAMTYRSFAVEHAPPHAYCDGIVPHAAQFFEIALDEQSRSGRNVGVSVSVETVCDITYSDVTNEKESFCARYHSDTHSGATSYMTDTLSESAALLANTSLARSKYPCAAAAADLPLVPNRNYSGLLESISIHSVSGLALLAYGRDIDKNCPLIPPLPHEDCTKSETRVIVDQ